MVDYRVKLVVYKSQCNIISIERLTRQEAVRKQQEQAKGGGQVAAAAH